MYRFNEAISLLVNCESQAEIDKLWTALSSGGGEPGQCGWLKDRYGLSWQIVPAVLGAMLKDQDPARVQRVTAAFMQMTKFDIPALERAFAGR
jgi:predicted 3-demethylubiquinone-9 3-methyltransferase (glyoxalase superfamily)